MTVGGRVAAYGLIILIGYSLALSLGEHFFPINITVVGVFVGCCVHAMMQILDWPRDPDKKS
jgi:hypothetical protein